MKASLVNLSTLFAILVATPAFAGICKKILGGAPVRSEYITTLVPHGLPRQLFESPSGEFQILSFSGQVEIDYQTYNTQEIMIRNKTGEAKLMITDRSFGAGENGTLVLNRAIYSPDESKILLLIDNPEKRSYFGKSNRFTLFDTKTFQNKIIQSDTELATWQAQVSYVQQENYPVVFSADSKTIYFGNEGGIEIVDVASGKRVGVINRQDCGYSSELDEAGNFEYDPAEWEYIFDKEKMTRTAFSPDRSRALVSFSKDAPVFYDIKAKKVLKKLEIGKDDRFIDTALEDNQNVVGIFSGEDLRVVRWNAKSGKMTTLYSNPNRKITIQGMTHRNGVSVIHTVETHREGISESFFVFTAGSKDVLELNSAAASDLLKHRSGYGTEPSRVEVSSTGEYSLVHIRESAFNYDAVIFNNKTGAIVGKIEGKRARFAENGKSIFYMKRDQTDFTRLDLP